MPRTRRCRDYTGSHTFLASRAISSTWLTRHSVDEPLLLEALVRLSGTDVHVEAAPLPCVLQTRRHHVWEQPGPPHRAVGPHGSHTLHQQPAGDGRLQHHHHRLPRRPDLPVGHDARAGGDANSRSLARSLAFLMFVKFYAARL